MTIPPSDGSDPFRRVEELFHRVADLPESEREEILAPIRDSEPEVYRQLERLLQAQERGSDLPGLELEGLGAAPRTDREETVLRWGNYRLLRQVGSGGMGVVWQAEQLRPIRRVVAIKVVPTGLDSERVVARFEAERQTIAAMSHPYIAQVFEAGETPDGRPYFAMEFVEGEAITRYCDAHELDVEARIRLLIDVCDGVSHAHQRGVIHRDLKPSNVLVAQAGGSDDRPLPKIIDFGISKATTPERDSDLTRRGEVVGTPQYMSPEQSAGQGAEVDVRTDVFSLGVILYELLTGETPRRSSASSTPRSESWVPPTRLTLPEDSITVLARRRRTTPALLRRTLRGDLEWVVLKALEEDTERRYPSVAALAADLRRYLERRPVSAGPPGAGYRLRRFVSRNRLLSAAAVLLTLATLAAVVGTSVGMVRAGRAEREALRAAAEAREQAELAERSKSFLIDLFQGLQPQRADGRELTVAEVFDAGVERVEKELADQPPLQAELLKTIASVDTELARYDEAEQLLHKAAALYDQLGPEYDVERAKNLVEFGRLYWRNDRLPEAAQALEEALRILREAEGDHRSSIASALNAYANVLNRDDIEASSRLFEEALAIKREQEGERSGEIGLLLASLGANAARSGRYEEAARRMSEALPMIEEFHGESDPRVGVLMGNLAFAYRKLGRFEEAHDLLERDLALTRRVMGEDHPALGPVLINTAAVDLRLGRWDDSVAAARAAVANLDASYPPRHRMVLLARNQLGVSLSARAEEGDLEEAVGVLGRIVDDAAEAAQSAPGMRRSWIRFQIALGEAQRRAGDGERAGSLARQARGHAEEIDDPALVQESLWLEAHAAALLGDAAVAQELAARARQLAGDPTDSSQIADLAFVEAKTSALLGRVDDAFAQLTTGLEAGLRNPIVERDPAFAALRADPRFANASRRLSAPLRAAGGSGQVP